MTLSLNGWKGLSMVVFAIISVIGAAIAVAMKEHVKQLYVTCGVLFSAGVLVSGGFVHLLFDSNKQFVAMGMEDFPWAYAIAGMTIVGLACLEIVLDRGLGEYMDSNNGKGEAEEELTLQMQEEYSYTALEGEEFQENANNESQNQNNEQEHDHTMQVDPENPFSAILVTIALSIHSIIEGLGVGAANDISQVEAAFIAIAFHKGFTAFALAEGMVTSGYWEDHQRNKRRKYFYISIGTFIFMSLLGIGIGWTISSSGEGNASTAVLTAITAGSFIYVAVFEILPRETKRIERERLWLLPVVFFFLTGFCLMSMLAIWA